MSSYLLDQERKEELILAKQVRQGTCVILGGNGGNVRESSPFVLFDQSSRQKRSKLKESKRTVAPPPNPDAIRKASNPIGLRYWNQCVQGKVDDNQAGNGHQQPADLNRVSATTVACQATQSMQTVGIASQSQVFIQHGQASSASVVNQSKVLVQQCPGNTAVSIKNSQANSVPPVNHALVSTQHTLANSAHNFHKVQQSQILENCYPANSIPAPQHSQVLAHHTTDNQIQPVQKTMRTEEKPVVPSRKIKVHNQHAEDKPVPPPWAASDYSAKPVSLTESRDKNGRKCRETRKTIVIKAKARSSSLPPWSRGPEDNTFTGFRRRIEAEHPQEQRNAPPKPGWMKQHSHVTSHNGKFVPEQPVQINGEQSGKQRPQQSYPKPGTRRPEAFLRRAPSPSPTFPLTAPAYRSRTPWVAHQDRNGSIYPEDQQSYVPY